MLYFIQGTIVYVNCIVYRCIKVNNLGKVQSIHYKTTSKYHLGNRDGLLLHSLVYAGLVLFTNAVELINATNASIS